MRFIEQLEYRRLLSASPATELAPAPINAPVQQAVLAALTNLLGSYSGTLAVSGVHTRAVKASITSQAAEGSFQGTVTDASRTTTVANISGKIAADNTMTMTMSGGGSHPGGTIAGTGTGTATVN